MTALEYPIVLARPGFNEKYNREVTWDELRKTFMLYRRIPMIVAGGSHSGPIDPNNAVGFVDAVYDDENKVIRGNALFFREKMESVPEGIRERLINKRYVPASLGYEQFGDLRKVDHLAIGVDSPVFKDIGFNAEDTFRYEETDGINTDGKEVQNAETAKDTEIQALRAEIQELKQLVLGLRPAKESPQAIEEPAVDEKEEKAEDTMQEPPKEAEKRVSPKPPLVEPERVIPKEQAKPRVTSDGLFSIEGNTRIVSTPVGRPVNNNKNKEKEQT
jgi:hypothetical protein